MTVLTPSHPVTQAPKGSAQALRDIGSALMGEDELLAWAKANHAPIADFRYSVSGKGALGLALRDIRNISDFLVCLFVAEGRVAKSAEARMVAREARKACLPIAPDAAARLSIVAKTALSSPDRLEMRSWHCGTSHCIAGWATTLAGKAGAYLEDRFGHAIAGLVLLGPEALTHFHDTNVEALEYLSRYDY